MSSDAPISVRVRDTSVRDTHNEPPGVLERTPALNLGFEGPRQTSQAYGQQTGDQISYRAPAAVVPFPNQSRTPGFVTPGTPNRANQVDPNLKPSEIARAMQKLANENAKLRQELKRVNAMKNPNPIRSAEEQEEEEEEEDEEERKKIANARTRVAQLEKDLAKAKKEIGNFLHGGDASGPTSKSGSHKHLPTGGKPSNKRGDSTGSTSPHVDVDPDDIAGQVEDEEEVTVRISRKPGGTAEGTATPRWSTSGYIDPTDAGADGNTDAKSAAMQVGTIKRREQVTRTVTTDDDGRKDDDDKAEEGTDVSQVPTGRGVKMPAEQEEGEEQEEEAQNLEQEEEEEGEEEEAGNPILRAAGLEHLQALGPITGVEQLPLIEARANSLPREQLAQIGQNAAMIAILKGDDPMKVHARESIKVTPNIRSQNKRVKQTIGYTGLPQLSNGPGAAKLSPMQKATRMLRELEKDKSLTAAERGRMAFAGVFADVVNRYKQGPNRGA